MPAAPFPPDEARRLSALLSCGVLDTGPDPAFDELAELAAELCHAPIALVSLVDRDRQWFKSRVGLDAAETPRSQAFCAHAILGDEPLVVTDARADPRMADNPLVTGPPGIRFYAGVPLRLFTGEALGTLCIIDVEPRHPDAATLRHLRRLGRQVANQLEQRATVARLEAATQAARAADEAKSAFLANMSHEIRTPMTAILGHADLLAEPDLAADPAHVAMAVGSIRRNGRHLLALINDILDLSKVEAGGMTVERLSVEVRELLEETVQIIAPSAAGKGLALRTTAPSPIPKTILTDPTRLRQVLVNLLSNAVKFTEKGSVELEVACDPGRERLVLRVRDTGIGMTEGQRDRVARFQAFSQADESTTRTHGGTGLGLPISHRILTLLGGDLELASTPGEGTTFTATIATGPLTDVPLVPLGDIAGPGTAVALPAPTGSRSSNELAGRHVLLAEDGHDNQVLLRFHLERAGARVTVVNDGLEAVAWFREHGGDHAADLVLMDLDMPRMGGEEATRILRHEGWALPILAVTAHAMHGDARDCLDAGCDGHVSKPIARATLLEACRAAIERAARRRAA